jgi:two-component system, NarL family, response regulator LiaR
MTIRRVSGAGARPPIKVMVVDDHPMVREGLQLFLSEARGVLVVGEAADGEEAVKLAQQVQPDVILMDLLMPRLGGIEAVERLRQAGVESRVIILTSFADDGRVRDALRAGAIGYLLKDVGRIELLGAIEAAARGLPALHPQAQKHLLQELTAPPAATPFDELTDRERDVLRLIARGESNKRIAAQLNLSVGTVKGYVSAVLAKLHVGDRTQAALLAAKHGLE